MNVLKDDRKPMNKGIMLRNLVGEQKQDSSRGFGDRKSLTVCWQRTGIIIANQIFNV
jgi:hypothetical protein